MRSIILRKTMTTAIPKAEEMPAAAPPFPRTYKSTWKRTTDVRLTRENFLDVVYGKTPTIKVEGFLSPEACWKLERELSPLLTPYQHNTGPLHTNVGVAQFEFQAQVEKDLLTRHNRETTFLIPNVFETDFFVEKEQYFQEAKKWHDLHSDLEKKTGINAWNRIMRLVATLIPEWDVEVASEGPDRKYFSGVFRALNETSPIHCDWAPHDARTEDWIINQISHQVVFNLYLAPVIDGLTILHDVQWTEDAMKLRDPTSYAYGREIVNGKQKAYVQPTLGSLCFFNSKNMHEVQKVDLEPLPELGLPYRSRLTLSSFMGLLPSEKTGGKPKLIFWS